MKSEAIEFQTLLKYDKKRHLVGVKFLFSEEEYEKQTIKEATHQMFFCMMVKAATVGHKIKATKEHLYCSAAAEVLGFKQPNSDTLSGKTSYLRNMHNSQSVAKSISEDTPYLNHNIYGIALQPLELCEEEPDIVLSFSQPYTAMRIIQGYSYKFGFAKNIRFSGMGGVCTEMVARAYKNKDINVSFLCSGTRFSAEWNDDEVGIAFPYDVFLSVLDGVKNTMNTFESDNKKKEVIERSKKNGCKLDIDMGNNYYDSCLGVAKIGTKGYHTKKI